MLLKEIKNIFHKELDGTYPEEEVNSFFYMLIAHYLGLERFILALQPNLVISKEEEQPLFEALSQLKRQKPIQYIIENAHFMEMDFMVNGSVLIPRPETEELVHLVLRKSREMSPNLTGEGQHRNLRILDIGTGSGCIAISLAKHLPKAEVYALDISRKALEVAKQNTHDLEVDVTFVHANILKVKEVGPLFDIIVSNPPYVRIMEKREMQRNVLEYEPETALYVPDGNPLIFYRAIAHFAKNNLAENGKLFLEINQYLGKETEALLREYNFSEIEHKKDMYGNDRMIYCRMQ